MNKTVLKIFFASVFILALTAAAYAQPANDLCADAIAIGAPSITSGTTIGSTFDGVGDCGTSNTTGGVWYTVVGTGNRMYATMCDDRGGSQTYDAKISVFTGDCSALSCVGGNDDYCGLMPLVAWDSQPGTVYRILVHGFGGATGNFDLAILDGPCVGQICYVNCLQGFCPESWCVINVPGLGSDFEVGQVGYYGCTPPCDLSECEVYVPFAP